LARAGLLLEAFLAHGDLALAQGGGAAGAEVIVNFLVGQDQEQPLADGHGRLAFLAIKTRCAKILELLHGITVIPWERGIKVSREADGVNPGVFFSS